MIEKGEKLYCHTSCIMNDSGSSATTPGKYYDVVCADEDELQIFNDQIEQHYFSLYPYENSYYKNWFTIERWRRKQKLKKIKDMNEKTFQYIKDIKMSHIQKNKKHKKRCMAELTTDACKNLKNHCSN